MYGAACAEFHDVLYVVGGAGAAGPQQDVWMAPIEDDGKLGEWRATTRLPAARTYAAAVAN